MTTNSKRRQFARRQFLRGAGGFTLGIPFLESLVPGRVLGNPTVISPKRLFAVMSMHGAVYANSLFPDASDLTEKKTLYPGHDVSRGSLARQVNGSTASVSKWLSASSSSLTDRLVGKMNILQGLDTPWYIGHNTGQLLGNWARTNTIPTPVTATPTIDQVMGWSPNFYADLTGIRQRVLVFGDYGAGVSHNYSDPAKKTGAIQQVNVTYDYGDLKAMFNGMIGSAATGPAPHQPVADRVLADYQRMRNGNSRMSPGDKQRLDDHMQRLSELQRKISVVTSCKDQTPPTGKTQYDGSLEAWHLTMDIVAGAFMCGTTRIAVGHANEAVPFMIDNWHGVAHAAGKDATAESEMLEHHRFLFENIPLYLAQKLDVDETPGTTYLDNSLLIHSMECGPGTHDSTSVPVATFGSAGGIIKTGQHIDYRNKRPQSQRALEAGYPEYVGLTLNQWLASVGATMGLQPSEWELLGKPGYGDMHVDTEYAKRYVVGVAEHASDFLPYLKA